MLLITRTADSLQPRPYWHELYSGPLCYVLDMKILFASWYCMVSNILTYRGSVPAGVAVLNFIEKLCFLYIYWIRISFVEPLQYELIDVMANDSSPSKDPTRTLNKGANRKGKVIPVNVMEVYAAVEAGGQLRPPVVIPPWKSTR